MSIFEPQYQVIDEYFNKKFPQSIPYSILVYQRTDRIGSPYIIEYKFIKDEQEWYYLTELNKDGSPVIW